MKAWKNVGVVGAGTMGSGIAQIVAQAGCDVVLVDASSDALTRSEVNLAKVFQRLVEKEGSLQKKPMPCRTHSSQHSVQELSECDVVVVAIVEDLGVKSNLFQTLETVVSHDAVLATNTSSLSVTALARACEHPSRVVGLHFFNPAPLMALVEVVPALQTQPALADHAMAQMQSWGKAPALAKDTPGFIVNRVARPFYSEALRILEEGVASVMDIDASMRAKGFRMGPFELMDLIGHDVNYAVTSTVHDSFYGDPKYRPAHTSASLWSRIGWAEKQDKDFTPTSMASSKEIRVRLWKALPNACWPC